jgi:hypothetical protein
MSDSQLEKLEKRKADIQRKIQRIKSAESKKKRQEETRRKILIGSAILSRVKKGEWPEDRMLAMMNEYLNKERDRELFALGPVSNKPEQLQE